MEKQKTEKPEGEKPATLQEIAETAIDTSRAMGGAGCTIRDGKRVVTIKTHFTPNMLRLAEEALEVTVEYGKNFAKAGGV